ncbi:MAG: ferritin-like domain-containing protein [Arcobacteraceae bacterium]
MYYFKTLETILLKKTPVEKFEAFEHFYTNFLNHEYTKEENYKPIEFKEPSYSSFLNIVLPKDVKRRRHFDTKEGKANLLHTICHIEYCAVDLALDASYRFASLPKAYYCDWLEVAQDEIRHFKMCEELLNSLGYKYGDFEVHTNLFEAMKKTTTLITRMAIVPRYLEANGLDQNPKIMEKLKSNPDEINYAILEALNIILEEEITHVQKGDKWFKYACTLEDLEPEATYLKLLEEFYPGSTQKKLELNFEARKKAGFSCNELKLLANKEECE